MIYHYANQLAEEHKVIIVHPNILLTGAPWQSLPARLIAWVLRQNNWSYAPGRWFTIDSRVQMMTVSSLDPKNIPHSDVIFATAWTTAEWVAKYPDSKGKKLYFVQDYEHLMTASSTLKNRMIKTYHGPFRIIVISQVLKEFLRKYQIKSTLIPNSIDSTIYRLNNALDSGSRSLIGFPYREEFYKGTQDVIAAFAQLIGLHNLHGKIWAYGAVADPPIPKWINYYPNLRDDELVSLFNQTKIFVTGSHFEGWGLPGMEAMACGATLVSTDTGGVKSYATHGVSALLSNPRNPQALAGNIERLIRNDQERLRFGRIGTDTIHKEFTGSRSYGILSNLLESFIND